jgi:hypothetical protein
MTAALLLISDARGPDRLSSGATCRPSRIEEKAAG